MSVRIYRVSMGMSIIDWKTFPAKTTKMLSTRMSSILRCHYYLLQCNCYSNQSVPSHNRVPCDLIQNIVDKCKLNPLSCIG